MNLLVLIAWVCSTQIDPKFNTQACMDHMWKCMHAVELNTKEEIKERFYSCGDFYEF